MLPHQIPEALFFEYRYILPVIRLLFLPPVAHQRCAVLWAYVEIWSNETARPCFLSTSIKSGFLSFYRHDGMCPIPS